MNSIKEHNEHALEMLKVWYHYGTIFKEPRAQLFFKTIGLIAYDRAITKDSRSAN